MQNVVVGQWWWKPTHRYTNLWKSTLNTPPCFLKYKFSWHLSDNALNELYNFILWLLPFFFFFHLFSFSFCALFPFGQKALYKCPCMYVCMYVSLVKDHNWTVLKIKIYLRGYCTSGPYFWRLCAFSQKIKQLRTKYPMDLVRNVPRNSKITVLLQQRPLLWNYNEKCAKINTFHVLNHKSITTWVSEIPVQ